MFWLEMSRDETHGGGDWAFKKCLWSPSLKRGDTRWAFWDNLLEVQAGDSVLHLRGIGKKAAFVGFSIAEADGFQTTDRPPDAGQWGYSVDYYRVPLKEYTAFSTPILLIEIFSEHEKALRLYFEKNKQSTNKRRLFYVVQSGRLQCLNGAYLSEVDKELAKILLNANLLTEKRANIQNAQDVSTREQIGQLLYRVGQREFSNQVRENYGSICCFPDCQVAEDRFLIGAHIARWADEPDLRGSISNGLCLCLMHDKAFEAGLFTLSFDLRIWVNKQKASHSKWAAEHINPYHGQYINTGNIQPSEEAIFHHWERVGCCPDF
jgi:putative restriction endonuclease